MVSRRIDRRRDGLCEDLENGGLGDVEMSLHPAPRLFRVTFEDRLIHFRVLRVFCLPGKFLDFIKQECIMTPESIR